MAGTIKVDSINADSNLALKIANTAVAFIDSSGLRPVSGNVSLDATATSKVFLPSANTVEIQTAGVTGLSMSSSQVVTLANALPVGSGGTGATSLSAITTGTSTNLAGGGANTVVYQSAAGTTAYLTNGTTGQFLAATTSGAPSWGTPSVGDHEVFVTTGNGHGSTNTKIRRFTTTQLSVGTAITYADSASLGATFTINETAIYSIEYLDNHNSIRYWRGISKNSTQLTTDVAYISAATFLAGAQNSTDSAHTPISCITKLTINDVIRAHTDGTLNNASFASYGSYFRIRKIGTI